MKIGFPKEVSDIETRVMLTPANAKKLIGMGFELTVEANYGSGCGYADESYKDLGVTISSDRDDLLKASAVVARISKPDEKDVNSLTEETIHVSFLDPFNEDKLVDSLKAKNVTSISLEMIPRSTLAQKMDVLSSQASLAGYVAVVTAAENLNKIFPMMMTPSGTISPSKVFIIGAGVAGLQAIATAKRMGARVEAFDTRPVVAEQVESLGGKFVKIDIGETGQTKDGYAKKLTDEQIQKQREGMAKVCAGADIVITTAQVFGRKAPVIVTKEMLDKMKPGSVVVDLAVETGGNVEGSAPGEIVDHNGVKIIGTRNLPGQVPVHASEMLSNNFVNLITHFWDKEAKKLNIDLEDEILQGCIITHNKEMINQKVKDIKGA
jgi:H+-translocating NAD(P) transhydrogenase subunit alpha